jgi:hypothetical protein
VPVVQGAPRAWPCRAVIADLDVQRSVADDDAQFDRWAAVPDSVGHQTSNHPSALLRTAECRPFAVLGDVNHGVGRCVTRSLWITENRSFPLRQGSVVVLDL